MSAPKPLAPGRAGRTLAARAAGIADRLRQQNTRFGLRPYRVLLRWTRWDGRERGDGFERDLATVELLPTPKVASMDSVTYSLFHAGTVPEGSLRVTEVSAARYTEDMLRGLAIPREALDPDDDPEFPDAGDGCVRASLVLPGQDVTGGRGESVKDPVQFFYEVVEDDRHGIARRKRFRLLNTPTLDAGKQMWGFLLERTSPDRDVDGKSPFAPPGR